MPHFHCGIASESFRERHIARASFNGQYTFPELSHYYSVSAVVPASDYPNWRVILAIGLSIKVRAAWAACRTTRTAISTHFSVCRGALQMTRSGMHIMGLPRRIILMAASKLKNLRKHSGQLQERQLSFAIRESAGSMTVAILARPQI